MYNQYGAFSSNHNYRDGDKFFFSRILSDREYQLTEPWSAKIVDEVVKEVQKCSYSLGAAEKHISAKILKENLHTSVKILQICMDLQDSVQRSLQNPAEKILQICTDSQRSKTCESITLKTSVDFVWAKKSSTQNAIVQFTSRNNGLYCVNFVNF